MIVSFSFVLHMDHESFTVLKDLQVCEQEKHTQGKMVRSVDDVDCMMTQYLFLKRICF